MKELIEEFINDVFTQEFIINVRKSISLFEAFEHQNAYNEMLDSITNESVADLHARAENFVIALSNQLNFIIKEHLIFLNDTATIADQIMIVDALYRIQHLDDYTPIEGILSLEDDGLDKMALILSELVTDHDQGYFLTILDSVDERTLLLLSDFINQKNLNKPINYISINNSVSRIKIFNKALSKDNIGSTLLEAGMLPGLELKLYLPYAEEYLIHDDNPELTAKDILSLIYISNTDDKDILNKYREIADNIIVSPEFAAKVESYVIKFMGQITDNRKIEHEKANLS